MLQQRTAASLAGRVDSRALVERSRPQTRPQGAKAEPAVRALAAEAASAAPEVASAAAEAVAAVVLPVVLAAVRLLEAAA
jgi:hypothetical protein